MRIMFTHRKYLPGDIFQASAEFFFTRHFFSRSAIRLFHPALQNTCEALVTMHTMFTYSKDLPGETFEAGANFTFILHEVLNDRALITDNSMKIITSSVSQRLFWVFYPALPSDTVYALITEHTMLTHSKEVSGDIVL